MFKAVEGEGDRGARGRRYTGCSDDRPNVCEGKMTGQAIAQPQDCHGGQGAEYGDQRVLVRLQRPLPVQIEAEQIVVAQRESDKWRSDHPDRVEYQGDPWPLLSF